LKKAVPRRLLWVKRAKGISLDISPAQRAGYWCEDETVLTGRWKSGVSSGHMILFGARPATL
jgi:hypothetical protein